LEQVDAALTSDPSNDELAKLRIDLQEVIDLTKELLTQQAGSSSESELRDWKVGDKCLAPWSQDRTGRLYEAVIEEVHPDGKVSVGFPGHNSGEITHLSNLKSLDSSYKPPVRETSTSSSSVKRVAPKESLAERKQALLKQKEYLKKRKQKKQARVQEQEQEREKEKKKWLNFSHKKGLMNKKKSIFASPETVDGRVGIGTCGVSGKPMTEFSAADKWRKGWTK
jgi:survival-of-motor-neuron-related-splicing factor 30